LHYGNGKPWEIANDCLITVCEPCHKEIHGIGVDELDKPKVKKRKAKPKSKPNPPEIKEKMMFSL
jgi:hypothetical protein